MSRDLPKNGSNYWFRDREIITASQRGDKSDALRRLRALKERFETSTHGMPQRHIHKEYLIEDIDAAIKRITDRRKQLREAERIDLRTAARIAHPDYPEGKEDENIEDFVKRVVPNQHTPNGTYYVSFKLVLHDKRYFTALLSDHKVHVGAGGIHKCIASIIHVFIADLGKNGAYAALVNITNIHIRHAPIGNPLVKVHLRDANPLQYDFLGNIETINKNAGECVLDYIIYEAGQATASDRHNNFSDVTRPALIKFFGPQCVEKGVSTKNIIRWARSRDDVRVIAINPLLVKFAEHHPEEQARLNLVFIVNNNHVYPIIDKDTKEYVARQGHLPLQEVKFDIKFDDFGSWLHKTDNLQELVDGTYCKEKKVILIDDDRHITELCTKVIERTRKNITRMKLSNGNVVMFQHPESKQYYIAAQELDERHKVADAMKKEIAHESLTFRNQSFTQLAHDWFSCKYGKLQQSTYSKEFRQILDDYALAAYIRKFDDKDEKAGQGFSIDIKRCYTSVLIDNKTDYNVFSAFDEVRKYRAGKPIKCGEFYISRDFQMHKLIGHKQGVVPGRVH